MTTIYTSSFRQFQPAMGQPVVISLTRSAWKPEAAQWPSLGILTPRWSYFRAEPDLFRESFIAQLERYGAREISDRLRRIGRQYQAETVVLICHEAKVPVTAATCHRRLAAEWMMTKLAGIEINEVP